MSDIKEISVGGTVYNVKDANALNKQNISNCITEIPQDIKLELNNGTLTLKAGSKVYVPNGSGVFNVFNITSDYVLTQEYGTQYDVALFVKSEGGIELRSLETICSGPNDTITGVYHFWYDTTNNIIRVVESNGSYRNYTLSFPFAIVKMSGTGASVSSIDQVFNGFGYIGSTVFALPGVKGLIPNGRNADGSLKNIEYSVSSPIIGDVPAYTAHYLLRNTGVLNPAYYTNYIVSDEKPDITNGDWYDTKNNYIHKIESGEIVAVNNSFDIGMFFSENSRFIGCNSKTAFHALDYNDKGTIVGWGMPDYSAGVTIPSSPYTAPSNGYVRFKFIGNSGGGTLSVTVNGNTVYAAKSDYYNKLDTLIPIKKGDIMTYNIDNLSLEIKAFFPCVGG